MRALIIVSSVLGLLACSGSGGAADAGGTGGSGGAGGGAGSGAARFSFFYTGLDAMRRLSGSPNGFGGDLRFGMPTGIEGADKICQTIAEGEGFTDRTWRAFLSAIQGPDGQQVDAIARVGEGPWYDRSGRLIAANKAGLLAERPIGDPAAVNDLPDETGQGTMRLGSTFEVITGSTSQGTLYNRTDPKNTCMDWTDATLEGVAVIVGHAWPFGGLSNHWIQSHPERTCIAGVNLSSNGVADGSSIGSGGGWGGFYCFALTP
jgi:hypothetical protein